MNRSLAVISPIAEELDVFMDHAPCAYSIRRHNIDESVKEAFGVLFHYLPDWILGIEEGLFVDVDMLELQRSVELLRSKLHSKHSRANLSILAGILGAYTTSNVDAIKLKPTASTRQVSLFKDFVEDETYIALSHEFHNLGVITKAQRSLGLISRYVRDLLQKPFARHAADMSTKAITSATTIPLPDSEMWETVFGGGYLPPVVSMRQNLEKAKADWQSLKPDIILPPGIFGHSRIEDTQC